MLQTEIGELPQRRDRARWRLSVSRDMIRSAVFTLDGLGIVLGSLVVHEGYAKPGQSTEPVYLGATLGLTILILAMFYRAHLYDFTTIANWPRGITQMFLAAATAVLLLFGLAFALAIPEKLLRSWVMLSTTAGVTLTWLARGGVALFVNRWSRADQGGFNIAIVGAGTHADRLISRISGAGASCWRPIGIFDDRKTRVESDVQGLRVLGDTQDLVDYVRTGLVQQVVIALPWSAEERLLALIKRLRELPVSISLGSDLIACHFTDNRQEVVGEARILEVERAPLSGLRGVAKWIEDKLLAGVLVLLFAPLMGLIALLVKLDSPGPALFRQIRYGFNNEQITVYKFRTMYHSRRGGEPFQQATKNDPRVTRVGSFLRRTSLDELPQLINVIEGRMSLIGPRPHPVALDEQYAALLAGYRGRFKMHPGITGWAQVNGWRGETESVDKMRGRVEHDLYYIENWSIWFDLRILWKTALLGWMHRNAY